MPCPNLLCEGIIELIVAEIGRSSHRRTYFVTMLSRFSGIHVVPKSATVKCQDNFERMYRSYKSNLFLGWILNESIALSIVRRFDRARCL